MNIDIAASIAPPSTQSTGPSRRVVVVTGAGQGIGRAFARAFAASGAVAVIPDLNEDKAASVAGEISAEGGTAMACRTDISDPASVERMVSDVVARHGRIDVLINNAAIFSTLKMRPFYEIPLEEWDRVLRVNVTGVFLCCRAVVPTMREHGWGRIITHLVRGSDARETELHPLHDVQGGAHRHDALARPGARRLWHHGQLDPARRDLHGDRARDRHARVEGAHRRAAMRPSRADPR